MAIPPLTPASKDIYLFLGARLRDERRRRKVSQDSLATRVGLTRTSIVNIEKGRQRLLVHTLVVIADVLGISASTLLPSTESGGFESLHERMPDDLSAPEKDWAKSLLANVKNKTKQ